MNGEYVDRFTTVDGVRTHYLEAGPEHDETVVLLHSSEYGASARTCWGYNVDALAEEYHVVAPDLLGYGRTDKLHDFESAFDRRIQVLAALLETIDVTGAHFVGNSMGAGYLASVACGEPPLSLPIETMVLVSGGGSGGLPERYLELTGRFDGSEESVRAILDYLLYDLDGLDEGFVEEKTAESRIPGHWETLHASRVEPPFEHAETADDSRRDDYGNVDVPTLVVGGEHDEMKPPGEVRALAERIPGAAVEILADCGHCAQIERPGAFHDLVLEFLGE